MVERLSLRSYLGQCLAYGANVENIKPYMKLVRSVLTFPKSSAIFTARQSYERELLVKCEIYSFIHSRACTMTMLDITLTIMGYHDHILHVNDSS